MLSIAFQTWRLACRPRLVSAQQFAGDWARGWCSGFRYGNVWNHPRNRVGGLYVQCNYVYFMFLHWTPKLFLKDDDVFAFVKQQSMKTKDNKDEHSVHLVHFAMQPFSAQIKKSKAGGNGCRQAIQQLFPFFIPPCVVLKESAFCVPQPAQMRYWDRAINHKTAISFHAFLNMWLVGRTWQCPWCSVSCFWAVSQRYAHPLLVHNGQKAAAEEGEIGSQGMKAG